ncbi:MAG: hypothetical protein ACI90G_001365, partial [Urechidicola sp.]
SIGIPDKADIGIIRALYSTPSVEHQMSLC